MALKQELQWQEPYVSKSLNSKLSGTLPPGIYQGFVVTPGGGMVLDVSPSSEYPRSVAVVDRAGYNFTVTSNETEHFTVPNGTSGTYFLCLDSEYIVGGGGASQFVFVTQANIQSYHVVLARLVIPGGTSTITAAMIDAAQKITRSLYTANPNHFINGAFDVWQLGTTQTSSGLGSDDKWYNEHAGSSKVHSRQSFFDDFFFSDGEKSPKFYSQTIVTSVNGEGNYARKCYRVPNVRNFSGQYVTISMYGSADSTKNIAIDAKQYFGISGSSSIEGIGAQKVVLSTSFEKKIITLFIPAITGKTVGSGGDDYIEFRLWFDAGSSFNAQTDTLGQQFGTFMLAAMKLETGREATRNLYRLYDEELALCRDYSQSLVPPGAIMHFARRTPPLGWIAADGSTVSRVAYQHLFIAIGTIFGAGDGSTTFKLPDLRGEFIRGVDGGRGVDSGRVLGSYQPGTKILGEIPDGSNNLHTIYDVTQIHADPVYETSGWVDNILFTAPTASLYSTPDGDYWWRTVRPRNVAMLACIKY